MRKAGVTTYRYTIYTSPQ